MGLKVWTALGSVTVCGTLLLAGCSSSNSATVDGGWNPPRPTGIPDEKWTAAAGTDPASLSDKDLADGYCPPLKPTTAEIDAKVQKYPGATIEEFNAYYDYVVAYVKPMCSRVLPAASPTGAFRLGVKRLSAQISADL